MKKNVIALAIASAIAAPVAMADAPTVYGKVNVAIDSVTDQGMFTKDRDSRIGVKGSEDLGNGLKAVYKMEFGVKVGDKFESLSGRNAYVGLAGGFGTVLLGRHDTPFKMSQAKDLFGDSTYADMGKSPLMGSLGYKGKNGEVRADNVVAYVSPSFGGVKIVAAGISAEGDAAVDVKDSSLANAYSVAAMYGSTKKGLYLAAAYNSFDKQLGTEWKELRVSAQYKTGGLIGNVIYQNFDDNTSADIAAEGSNVQVNLGYKMGKIMPKAKYSTTDYKMSGMDDVSSYALGLDYSFGKKTTGYVEYVDSDKNLTDKNYVSVGMIHKF